MELTIVLSDLPIIRRRLASRFSSSPSLIAEAFARGLGHATHAAALAVLSRRDPWENTYAPVPYAAVPFDPVAFCSRLGGVADPGAVADTLRLCGVAAGGPDVLDLYNAACGKVGGRSRNDVEGLSDCGMRGAEKFAFVAWTLHRRMGAMGWLADWYRYWAQPFGLKLHRRLGAACQLHADLDPDMARFLSDAMAALDRVAVVRDGTGPMGEIPGDDDRQAAVFRRFDWMDDVYMAFRPRIASFFDKVARRWDPVRDPFLMEPTWTDDGVRNGRGGAAAGRGPRSPGITVGLTEHARSCRFAVSDTGNRQADLTVARGLPAFALWRSGVPTPHIEAFRAELGNQWPDPSGAVCAWVDLDGTGGAPSSQEALARACWPAGMPARPDRESEAQARRRTEEAMRAREEALKSLPPPRWAEDDDLRTHMRDPVALARVFHGTDERLEVFSVHEGQAALMLTSERRTPRCRLVEVDPCEGRQAMRCWLEALDPALASAPRRFAQGWIEQGGHRIRMEFEDRGDEGAFVLCRMLFPNG